MRSMAGLAAAALAALLAVAAQAGPSPVMVDEHGVAANGYDVVAYFDNRASRGLPTFSIEHRGAVWYFESEQNAARFQNSPERFVPEFGGYCAYGVSQGYLVGTDPDAWSVVGGRLYLNYNVDIRNRWLTDLETFVAVAEKHWPRLVG